MVEIARYDGEDQDFLTCLTAPNLCLLRSGQMHPGLPMDDCGSQMKTSSR